MVGVQRFQKRGRYGTDICFIRLGTMKITVQREDGSVETLNLCASLFVQEGRHLNRIITATGCEYFFTHEGRYDGWGAGVQATEAEASAVIDAMESKGVKADS